MADKEDAVRLLMTLCGIPAPMGEERARTGFCVDYFRNSGAKKTFLDRADNAICEIGDCSGEVVIFAAHADTVFPDREPFRPKLDGDLLHCPGAGDNTANMALLLLVAGEFMRRGRTPKTGVVLAVNSGEEGLGNLRGVKKLMETYGSRTKEFVALDGTSESIVTRAVGSARYEITLRTPGGHSYFDFGRPNAILRAAELIQALYAIPRPEREGVNTTCNVGAISGGTAVNAIAQEAKFLYEYRSGDAQCLEIMGERFRDTLAGFAREDVTLQVVEAGNRPCGTVPEETILAAAAPYAHILRDVTGAAPKYLSASTDGNIPLAQGVPAVSFGGYRGGGAHTRQEYMELSSLTEGLEIFRRALGLYFQ